MSSRDRLKRFAILPLSAALVCCTTTEGFSPHQLQTVECIRETLAATSSFHDVKLEKVREGRVMYPSLTAAYRADGVDRRVYVELGGFAESDSLAYQIVEVKSSLSYIEGDFDAVLRERCHVQTGGFVD